MSKSLIFFGAGEACRLSIGYAATRRLEVAYIVDNDSAKWGTSYKGIPIIAPKDLATLMNDNYEIVVTVGPKVVRKIGEQLQSMGFVYGRDFVSFYDKFYCGTIPASSEPGFAFAHESQSLLKPITDCVLTVDHNREYVYRSITEDKADHMEYIFQQIQKNPDLKERMVRTEIDKSSTLATDYPLVFKHEYLPLISYCSEWSPLMFRDYVLFMIDFLEQLDQAGLGLQDPSLFNTIFHRGKFLYVDYTGIYWSKTNWFIMQTFLELHINVLILLVKSQEKGYMYLQNPMMVAKYADISGYFSQEEKQNYENLIQECESAVVKGEMPLVCQLLREFVQYMTADFSSISDWTGYQDRLYFEANQEEHYTIKQKEVLSLVDSVKPNTVLDLAGNMGWYSITLSNRVKYALTIDIDSGITDSAYEMVKKAGVENVYPVCLNFITPTLAKYRNVSIQSDIVHPYIKGALDRFQCELILVLAVVHHLALSQGLSFQEIIGQLNQYTSKYMIIEFVDREDEWVSRYLRQYSYERTSWYTKEQFESALQEKFSIQEIRSSDNATRTLYLCEKR